MDENLQKYIKQMREQGRSDAQIRVELRKTGWTNEQIDAEMLPQEQKSAPAGNSASASGAAKASPRGAALPKKGLMGKLKLSKLSLAIIGVAVVLAVTVWALAYTGVWNPFVPLEFQNIDTETNVGNNTGNNTNTETEIQIEENPVFPDSYAFTSSEMPAPFNAEPLQEEFSSADKASEFGIDASHAGDSYAASYASGSGTSEALSLFAVDFVTENVFEYYISTIRANINDREEDAAKFLLKKENIAVVIIVPSQEHVDLALELVQAYQTRLQLSPIEFYYSN